MVREIVAGVNPNMDKAIIHLEEELKSLRTGRATTALVENIMVESYGQNMPLISLATLSTPDARTIAITPWDRSAVPNVEKALREAQSLGLNPNNDGSTIRLNIPPMTEERRRDIVKALGHMVEGCHITMRAVRHEALSDIKKLEKDKKATTDDVKWSEEELNKKIDHYRLKIDAIQKQKEIEIMQV